LQKELQSKWVIFVFAFFQSFLQLAQFVKVPEKSPTKDKKDHRSKFLKGITNFGGKHVASRNGSSSKT